MHSICSSRLVLFHWRFRYLLVFFLLVYMRANVDVALLRKTLANKTTIPYHSKSHKYFIGAAALVFKWHR